MKSIISKFKKLGFRNKVLVVLLAFFVIGLTLTITFGRYVYTMVQNHILETKGFYFNSTVMSSLGSNHSINNWDGVNAYKITVDVNNKKNDLVWTQTDIAYDIEVHCSDNIRCVTSKTSGTIRKDVKSDSYTITIYPIYDFENNQTAEVVTTVKSTYPFEKELSATYNIGIETSKFSYSINDQSGEKYFMLELTNAFTYYAAKEAFLGYAAGENISIEEYEELSDANKAKCMSAIVSLKFDPNLVLLDMTDETYIHRSGGNPGLTKINGYDYVNSFSFDMQASSTIKILFYKNDPLQDYTYPSENSIINVNVLTVEDY